MSEQERKPQVMPDHPQISLEDRSRAAAQTLPRRKEGNAATAVFQDNRPEAAAQGRLQELANNSPQANAASQLQAKIDHSRHMAVQRQQVERVFGGAVELQEGLEEELPLPAETAPVLAQGSEDERPLSEKIQPVQKRKNKTGLPDNLKSGIESLSGMSMDDVKVHYNSAKPAQLQALAYTQGTDIQVGPGQEQPLPHEAWHVAQQQQGRVKPTMQMAGIKVGEASTIVTQLLKDNRKTIDIDTLNYAQLKLYAEKPAGVEFDNEDDLQRINARIAEFEGVQGVNKVDCGEGEVKTATPQQIIYFSGITSCLAITVILDDGSKIAAHKALESPIVDAPTQIKALIGDDRTIASVTVGGILAFWTHDLRRAQDLGADESIGVWGLGEAGNAAKLQGYLATQLGTEAGKVDVQSWEDGKYAISATGEPIIGVREPKAAQGWIMKYTDETFNYTATAATVIDWLIQQQILEADEREDAIQELKEFVSIESAYQTVITDWFTIRIPDFTQNLKNHGQTLYENLFAIHAFTIEGAVEYEETQEEIIAAAILSFKRANSYQLLGAELQKAKKELDDIEVG
ncbi:MAG: DUF4157 domain-containing protein [Dehalococcoidia bacterium]